MGTSKNNMNFPDFHPAVEQWFKKQFEQATAAQLQSWPAIRANRPTLIAAPTGSGKTLAAFLAAIDELIHMGINQELEDKTYVLYISPLKALSNDIQKNLQLPLNGIRDELLYLGQADIEVRAWVRTGDTPQKQRVQMRRQHPHILVTTPESLYILLSSESGRAILQNVRTTIIDEIHALAGNKRGAHLMLSLERLQALCLANNNPAPNRIGLSATQKPLDVIALFLTGGLTGEGEQTDTQQTSTKLIDTGHVRNRDLQIILPDSPLEAIMSNETWEEIYKKLVDLINEHNTTLIFVNTRRMAERLAHQLAEFIGEENVTSHHGSLAREHRLAAEQRLKAGKLSALVATASLELGIDIGDIDLVCQIGSPRYISTFLQRVGRSGHTIGGTPKGRLFPLSLDDLMECAALQIACQQGDLDKINIPSQPLDVLAQHIVAEVASREWEEKALYECLRNAYPYRNLTSKQFKQIIQMLADGFSTRRGRRSAYIHYDAVNGRLRARRGARLTAITNGGAIPDLFDYDVVLQPEGHLIGNLNEDFAFESLPGDIFQLGNISYRILKIEQGKVFVQDAHGQPPNIPFWFGEAPGRSDELSDAVSSLRTEVAHRLGDNLKLVQTWLCDVQGLTHESAMQICNYMAVSKASLGVMPSKKTIVLERFFDEVGDMHLIVHSPYGSRINRAWGLALRKRFCRKFNFELQAAANENSIVLSLGPTHSFPLEEVSQYLHSNSVRHILIQAMLDAPVFATRWRWNANIALAVPRFRGGKRVPAQFQRSNAEDLVAVVFPDQIACFENIAGEREIPDHPLVEQTIHDCLYDNMDIEGLESILKGIENNEITVVARDLVSPSPMALEIINARPYAFLDDAPAEERRTLAIQQRRHLNPQDANSMDILDIKAINRVKQEAWPEASNADEIHDAIVLLGFVTQLELNTFAAAKQINTLLKEKRVTLITTPDEKSFWVSAERLSLFHKVFPAAKLDPEILAVGNFLQKSESVETALVDIIRSRLEGLGPVSADLLSDPLGISSDRINTCLLSLEGEGFAVRGYFTPQTDFHNQKQEWCDRRLLARIHRYTIKTLRKEIEPVSPAVYMQFLFEWQHFKEKVEGIEALHGILQQLEGLSVPAVAWEKEILPARINHYQPEWLDQLCITGRMNWLRLHPAKTKNGDAAKPAVTPVSITPISLIERQNIVYWDKLFADQKQTQNLSSTGLKIYHLLKDKGALFFSDIVKESGLLQTQVEKSLGQLVSQGLITSDSFAGLRALTVPSNRKPRFNNRRPKGARLYLSIENAGRWSRIVTSQNKQSQNEFPQENSANMLAWDNSHLEHIAQVLLQRYGVVFRKVLERENTLPPWRDLLYVFRRMESKGEIRGGRFVNGFSGEQFAYPGVIKLLRSKRNDTASSYISISAADPTNLTGIITPGKRVPALTKNRILYQDGVPIAVNIGGKIEFLDQLDKAAQWDVRNHLIKSGNPGSFMDIATV